MVNHTSQRLVIDGQAPIGLSRSRWRGLMSCRLVLVCGAPMPASAMELASPSDALVFCGRGDLRRARARRRRIDCASPLL